MSAIIKKYHDLNFQDLLDEGLQLHRKGQYQAALYYYSQALKINPDDALLNNLLGMLARKEEQYERAAYFFSKAVKLDSYNHEFLYNLSLIELESGSYDLSECLIIKAIKLEPNKADYFCLLGKIYIKKMSLDKARGAFFTALKINSSHIKSLYQLAKLYRYKYNRQEAEKYYELVLEHNENHIGSLCDLACMGLVSSLSHRYLIIERLIKQEQGNTQARLLLAKGYVLHFEKEYLRASKYFKQGNLILKSSDDEYNKRLFEEHLHFLKKVIKTKRKEAQKMNEFTPCMILGPSTSGKSLIEYLLTKNSTISAGYENQLLYKVSSQIKKESAGYFDGRLIQEQYLGKVRDEYLQLHKKLFNGSLLTTSTRPNDIFLILPFLQALPEMRLIACYRNPNDIALSMYMRDYETGNNYNTDLQNCLHYINHYQKTMDILQVLFPDQLIKVQYEDLVTKPQATMKSIVNFLELRSYKMPEVNFTQQNIGISKNYESEFIKL